MHNLEWEKILREMIRVSGKYVILSEAITEGKMIDRKIRGTDTPSIQFNPSDLTKIMAQYGEATYYNSVDTKGRVGKLGTFLLMKHGK